MQADFRLKSACFPPLKRGKYSPLIASIPSSSSLPIYINSYKFDILTVLKVGKWKNYKAEEYRSGGKKGRKNQSLKKMILQ